MRINLSIDYRTRWGETLWVAVDTDPHSLDIDKARMMTIEGDSTWRLGVDIDADAPGAVIYYSFYVCRDDGSVRSEWGPVHKLAPGNAAVCDVLDHWHERAYDTPFRSSAFVHSVFRRDSTAPLPPAGAGLVTFKVSAPTVRPGETVAVAGDSEALGKWQVAKAPRMSDGAYPEFVASVVANADMEAGSEFKFVIVKEDTGEIVAWEEGGNHRMPVAPAVAGATVLAGFRLSDPRRWRGAGTAIPVFSLRSEADFGVGDFLDLIPMVDWAVATGQHFLQVLPINDTTMSHTWMDSYPYNANSTFALHPMYLRVTELGDVSDPERRKYYADRAAELNALPEIDYERVNRLKNEYTREIFGERGAEVTATPEFADFVERNARWLRPYAAFCILRDRYATPCFAEWGEYAVYTPEIADRVLAEAHDEAAYVFYIQYNLDRQMRRVSSYARSRGVAIKGDIPIGISRTSADAWMSPELFNMDSQAGAPPDDFSVLGQNWGFPTYNWDEMARDGYAWWRARFSKMSEYFDAYRIDHVLGFFRIWEIPMDAVHGLLGHFNPALPFSAGELRSDYDFWLDPAVHTVPFIMDYFLTDVFGVYADEVRELFLEPLEYGRHRLKPEYDTQRKVVDYFAGAPDDDRTRVICTGLLALIDDVLFIRDPADPDRFHPRISARETYIYRSLTDYEKWCFDRLYNDFFYHRHNGFWYDKAMQKLPPLIDATEMLVCAEDLGMIPACVPSVMDQLQILALEIQRMPKQPGVAFGDPRLYPYHSVCTTSTHDMTGIRGWWEEDTAATQDYYNNVLHCKGEAPAEATPEVCAMIVERHLQSRSMLCILPLQDWLSIDAGMRRPSHADERINVPADSRHYWRYRMHLTIEELLASTAFNTRLTHLIRSTR